jgi:hypothetical protein
MFPASNWVLHLFFCHCPHTHPPPSLSHVLWRQHSASLLL